MYQNEPPHVISAQRRTGRGPRRLPGSTWFAIASLYLLLAAGATLTSYLAGIRPASMAMVRQHAEHAAALSFQSLYSLMTVGASREQLQQMALRIEQAGPGVTIFLSRGTQVAAQFGDLRDSQLLKETDPGVMAAFQTGQPQTRVSDDRLDVAYPVIFARECLQCHSTGKVGEVAGVVAVTYPTAAFESPRRSAVLPLLIYFALGFPVLMMVVARLTGETRR